MIIYFYSLVIVALVLVAHLFGLDGLYVQVPVYDIFMHMMGGFGVGLLAAGCIYSFKPDLKRPWLAIVIGVFAAGLAWEIFEVYYDIAGYHFGEHMYYVDTVKDLIDDMIGGLGAAMVLRRLRLK